jgi:ATP-binding protein involved in chromosome partitioning
MSTPQEKARLEAIKKTWQQKRQITQRFDIIKTKVGVYSGKGGVGKTTIAVNLASALAHDGHQVGLLDVDIDCPNVTKAMGISDKPVYQNGEITPSERFGVKVVSMAFFQENEEEAIIWRGPMIHNAINQFLQMTAWGELDYLVVDLPPGTSDAPLTVMQTLPLDGFVVVTTPQQLANLDARRCINMIRKLKVNVLGLVENYSGEIFGQGAGEELAKEMDLPFLGSIALRADYRDISKPTVLVSPDVMGEYRTIIEGLEAGLKARSKSAD